MSPLGITALLLLSFAAFAALAARKLVLLTHLQPDPRWDDAGARLRSVLSNGLLQRRMIRFEWRPGVMHAVIFLGFLTLLVRKVELLVIGYDATHAAAGPLGGAFAFAKDFVALAVLLAVAYAFYRRIVLKPTRLEPNGEGILVLSLIAIIMLTDYAFDAFRFAQLAGTVPAIAHERAYAPIGDALARLVDAWPTDSLALGAQLMYWAQMITVFSFLVLLPTGEHFHIVTALPALFFRRGEPANAVPTVDLSKLMDDDADAGELRIGIRSAADLTWKDGLDAFTCTECGRCKDACPTFLTGKPLSMKWVHDSVKQHLLAQRTAVLAGGQAVADLPPLVGDVVSEEALWACTTCGYCESACPIELEHVPKLLKLRQHQVLMAGEFPKELRNVFQGYEVQSNPWGLPADARGDWAKGTGVPVARTAEDVAALDWLFYVGSAESFDPRGQKIAKAFVEILRAAGVRFAILGADEPSTGECARRAGNEMLFQQLAATLVDRFRELGVRRIVTCDPHAYNSLRNEYPEFGGEWEVKHHTRLISELLDAGRIAVAPTFDRVLFHDPCYLGRHNGEFESPRRLVRRVSRDTPLEYGLCREKAMCCGAGGGRMWMEETIGKRINVARVEQALVTEPAVLATACPYCATMLGDGLKTLHADERVQTRDVAELVAAALVPSRAI